MVLLDLTYYSMWLRFEKQPELFPGNLNPWLPNYTYNPSIPSLLIGQW